MAWLFKNWKQSRQQKAPPPPPPKHPRGSLLSWAATEAELSGRVETVPTSRRANDAPLWWLISDYQAGPVLVRELVNMEGTPALQGGRRKD